MTTSTDVCRLPLYQIADRIHEKALSPVEVTEAVLERIERLNPQLDAFITVTAEEALAAARAAADEIAAGNYRGPLHGVPIGVKDLCDMRGVPTTAGAKVFGYGAAQDDSFLLKRFRAAGAVIVGKTHLHECAFGATGLNPHYGPARNPWNTDCITGGSSSGSGAAVAAGLCYAAIGSDTGGSIRIPSALCGIAGIKPTYGRVSLRGVVPLAWSLDHLGPMARTVRDCALVLEAVAGHDPQDPSSADAPVEPWAGALVEAPEPPASEFTPRLSPVGLKDVRSDVLSGVRIGVPRNALAEAEQDVVGAMRDATAALQRLGAEVRELDLPQIDAYWVPASVVLLAQAAEFHRDTFERRAGDYGDDVRERIAAGLDIKATDFIRSMRQLREARATCDEVLLKDLDLLALPTTKRTAVPIEDARAEDPTLGLTRLTAPFDVTGQPAMSVPCGLSAAGLPIGLQLVGRRFDELTVLRAAHVFETRSGVAMPQPPVE